MSERLVDQETKEAPAASAPESAAAPGRQTLAQQHDGQPLPQGQRQKYEATLGTSLGDVRVHKGPKASALADKVDARAFAYGNSIFMGAGQDPNDPGNDRLLAEEVAHTVQQRGATPAASPSTTDPSGGAEQEAKAAASAMVAGQPASVSSQPSAIARSGKNDKKDEPVERTEVDHFESGWFSADPYKVTKAGGISTVDMGDVVRFQSPDIIAETTARANLPNDKKLGNKAVKVGPIQTLMSSTRTGIYKKANETKEKTNKMGRVRDVAPVTSSTAQNTYNKNNDDTFYGGNAKREIFESNKGVAPERQNPAGDPSKAALNELSGDGNPSAPVTMIDAPGIGLRKTLDDGARLVGMKGADEFNTSVGFRTPTGQMFAKAPFGWRLSWDKEVNLDKPQAEAKAAGPEKDAITTFDADEAVVESGELYAVNLAAINSIGDANQQPAAWLLRNLPKAREVRPEAAEFMEQALATKKVSITVNPRDSATGTQELTADIFLAVTASISKQGKTHEVSTKYQQATTVGYTLGALADPKSLSTGSTVAIAVSEKKNEWYGGVTTYLGGTADLALPGGKGDSTTISASGGTYVVTLAWG